MKSDKFIEVNIFGEDYKLISNNDEERIIRVAQLVDEKMKLAAANYPTYSKLKVAVLVALNLGDDLLDYYESKKVISNIIDSVCKKIDDLTE